MTLKITLWGKQHGRLEYCSEICTVPHTPCLKSRAYFPTKWLCLVKCLYLTDGTHHYEAAKGFKNTFRLKLALSYLYYGQQKNILNKTIYPRKMGPWSRATWPNQGLCWERDTELLQRKLEPLNGAQPDQPYPSRTTDTQTIINGCGWILWWLVMHQN